MLYGLLLNKVTVNSLLKVTMKNILTFATNVLLEAIGKITLLSKLTTQKSFKLPNGKSPLLNPHKTPMLNPHKTPMLNNDLFIT